jgi:hypothetical protein
MQASTEDHPLEYRILNLEREIAEMNVNHQEQIYQLNEIIREKDI